MFRTLSCHFQSRLFSTAPEVVEILRLNNLRDNVGAVKKARRIGRGIGCSKGKTSGRGHKGQKARAGGSIPLTFEGGQTKLYKLLPKRGFKNRNEATQLPINIGTIQDYVDMGRLDASKVITLHDMKVAGMFKANGVKHGVKLLSEGKERLKQPLLIEVTRASSAAIDAVEQANGQVTTVHMNRLALRQELRPESMKSPVRNARPPPRLQPYYTNFKNRGYLNPVVQMRNWLQKNKPELAQTFDEIRSKQTKQGE